jgi:retron-type reverse transcriptase
MNSTRINESLLLWAIGVIQPASPIEIVQIIERIARTQLPPGAADGITHQCDHYVNRGLLRLVNTRKKWYSLTYIGDVSIPKDLRRRRDRMRLFLLKEAWKSRMITVGVLSLQKSIDDSSIIQHSGENIQEIPRPTKSCARGKRGHERFRWPRIFEQISKGSGSASSTPTSLYPPNPLTFYSFSEQHRGEVDNPYPINAKELALAIGVSARLLTSIGKVPERHYRRFKIPKADGTFRDIASPKLFLKVIQYWIKDYILFRLPIHESCYSFLKGVSIADNAGPHVGKKYVATIDVENFFGSIKQDVVAALIKKAGYTAALARIISKLATLDDALPQGAPTSPIISNSYLFKMDESLSKWCAIKSCSYTRYADDITISGNDRDIVTKCIGRATQLLHRYGLRLKESKTRIQSRGGRQVVTGLVVNEKVQPTREQRRMVRAMLNCYQKGLMQDSEDIARLRGWLSYFRSFDHLKEKFVHVLFH